MTEEGEGNQNVANELTPPPADRDRFLEVLVNLANYTGLQMPVTLSIGGNLVWGRIIPVQEYFEEMKDTVRRGEEAGPGEPVGYETLIEPFIGAYPSVDDYYEAVEEGDDNAVKETVDAVFGDVGVDGPDFIHLEDSQHWAPGGEQGVPTDGGTYWRGRLSSVDGFSLGTMTVTRG